MIYFDNAATSPMCGSAKEIMQQDFGNPSSPHSYGLEAERAIKKAGKYIASVLSCKSEELIFTSGATESNNIGILGAAFSLKSSLGHNRKLHILSARQEHPSIVEPLLYLASMPGFSVTFAAPSEWEALVNEDTAMICISQVNSETGDIFTHFPLPANIIVFIDGAQAFCKISVPDRADIYTFSAHKFHGPMGVGGLMIRKGLRLQPLMYGGGQQGKIRPGTENVPGILAMASAVKEMHSAGCSKAERIKDILCKLAEEVPDTFINQTSKQASPFILNLSFCGVRGETLTNLLSSRGLYVSMGTACRTSKKESALESMGFSKERAESAIRLSFSHMNTEEEAYRAKDIIKKSLAEIKNRRNK